MAPRSETLQRVDPAPARHVVRPAPAPTLVVIPTYDEAENIAEVLRRVREALPRRRHPRRRRRESRRHRRPRRRASVPSSAASACCGDRARRGSVPRTAPASRSGSRTATACSSRWTPTSRTILRPSPGWSARWTEAPTSRSARATWTAPRSPNGARADVRCRGTATGTRGSSSTCRSTTSPRDTVPIAPRSCARCTPRPRGRRATRSRSSSRRASLRSGHTVVEVPIEFNDRTAGSSKMSTRITIEALARVDVVGATRPRPGDITLGMTTTHPPVAGVRRTAPPRTRRALVRSVRLDPRDLALIALVVIGAGLRLWALGRSRLNYDESFTAMAGRLPVDRLFAFLTAHDSHPPLDYLLHAPFARAGVSEFWFRLPSAACSIAALALLAWWLRPRGRVAIIATAILALSAFQIAHGRDARMYAELELLGVGIAMVADHWRRAPQRHHAPLIGRAGAGRALHPRLDVPRSRPGSSRSPGSDATARRGVGERRSSRRWSSGP